MNVFKCDCGQKLNINSKYCPECGKKLDYEERKQESKIIYITLSLFVLLAFLLCILFFVKHEENKIRTDTPEYQDFVKKFETIMELHEHVTAYSEYGDYGDYIVIETDNKSFSIQQQVAELIQSQARDAGVIKQNNHIKVKCYYKGEFIREFY